MNLPLAPLVGVTLGGAAAAAALVLPGPVLEHLVMSSGLPAVVSAAEPPLGTTARLAIAGGAGGAAALLGWFALFLLLGARAVTIGGEAANRAVPVLRRADAHPDAPPRAPLLATRDLGTPFLEVTAPAPRAAETRETHDSPTIFAPTHLVAADQAPPPPVAPVPPAVEDQLAAFVEQPLPRDLNQPLAAFDPEAIPDVPLPRPVKLPPARRPSRPAVFDAGERFETFELTPPVRPAPVPPHPDARRPEPEAKANTEATIHALLDRLEKGVVKRGLAVPAERSPREAERGLEEALVTLRNLARRA